mmetsp:Transcript_5414/g.11960  ORF Transcript_5414/g.11960 Transcript_5414/m.11960 type:complete len:212 (+) Transcript_5414:80-715(+)
MSSTFWCTLLVALTCSPWFCNVEAKGGAVGAKATGSSASRPSSGSPSSGGSSRSYSGTSYSTTNYRVYNPAGSSVYSGSLGYRGLPVVGILYYHNSHYSTVSYRGGTKENCTILPVPSPQQLNLTQVNSSSTSTSPLLDNFFGDTSVTYENFDELNDTLIARTNASYWVGDCALTQLGEGTGDSAAAALPLSIRAVLATVLSVWCFVAALT